MDNAYERTWGWIKTVFASLITALIVSGIEFHNTSFSVYENTVEWTVDKLDQLVNWLKWWD